MPASLSDPAGRRPAGPDLPAGGVDPERRPARSPLVMRPDGLGTAPQWFVVLPDSETTAPVAADVRSQASQQIRHPSGRPWILGRWADDALTTARAGQTAVAVIGQHATDHDQLREAAGRIRTVADVDRLAASLVGSVHLVASVHGRVRVQGTVTGVRRVFHASVGGVRVAADRADVLTHLAGLAVDERRLALHLLEPQILYPLAGQPVWRGVTVLPGDSYLVLDDRSDRSVRWWTPPEPSVPMAQGAPALRDALSAAVAVRISGRRLVSSDLGGLDSTAVCSLAARGPATLVAYTAASLDPLADDVAWAAGTVAGLGNVEHHVISAAEMPLVFHGLRSTEDRFDEPCNGAVDRDRWLAIVERAAARGSQLHLTGMGGDELLYGSPAHLHALLRTSPRLAWRNLRGFAAKYRWPRGALLRQLADSSSYPQWLARVAGTLNQPRVRPDEPLVGWGFTPRLPSWTTSDAAVAVRDQILAEAAGAEPLGVNRGQHRELEAMRYLSRLTRQFEQMAARIGLMFAAPYYDDRVIEVGLAVRPQERVTPWRYKPLIVEAMRGIVPAASLARQTKANGSGDEEPGLRRHRADLLALWEDSRLSRLGLIDAAALRDVCARPLPPSLQFGALDQTVAGELWLRSLEPATTPVPS